MEGERKVGLQTREGWLVGWLAGLAGGRELQLYDTT